MDQIERTFWVNLIENCPEISLESMQRWNDNPGELRVFLEKLNLQKAYVDTLVEFNVSGGVINLKEPFASFKGLWMSHTFRRYFGKRSGEVSDDIFHITESKIGYIDLKRTANSKTIRSELPKDNDFDVLTFIGCLVKLLENQSNASNKVLLDNGNSNIFFVSDTFVQVVWKAEKNKWCCYAQEYYSRFGDAGPKCYSGMRVFSASTV